MPGSPRVFLDIELGDPDEDSRARAEFQRAEAFLEGNGAMVRTFSRNGESFYFETIEEKEKRKK